MLDVIIEQWTTKMNKTPDNLMSPALVPSENQLSRATYDYLILCALMTKQCAPRQFLLSYLGLLETAPQLADTYNGGKAAYRDPKKPILPKDSEEELDVRAFFGTFVASPGTTSKNKRVNTPNTAKNNKTVDYAAIEDSCSVADKCKMGLCIVKTDDLESLDSTWKAIYYAIDYAVIPQHK